MSPSTMIVLALMLIFAGYATADFSRICLDNCEKKCTDPKTQEACHQDCVRKCIPPNPSDAKDVYYCKVGCAIDQCTQFGKDVRKVGSCVDNCFSNICGKHS
ncbi:hypothetical protein SLE2022_311700 [Rubroshorea leprosula]